MQTRSKSTCNVESRHHRMVIVSSSIETRSMKSQKYSFVFNFEDSSLEWRRNKKSIGNGSFVYKT